MGFTCCHVKQIHTNLCYSWPQSWDESSGCVVASALSVLGEILIKWVEKFSIAPIRNNGCHNLTCHLALLTQAFCFKCTHTMDWMQRHYHKNIRSILFCLSGSQGAGTYFSYHGARGRAHPGQVASLTQGWQRKTDNHSHLWAISFSN